MTSTPKLATSGFDQEYQGFGPRDEKYAAVPFESVAATAIANCAEAGELMV